MTALARPEQPTMKINFTKREYQALVEGAGHSMHRGVEADLRANLSRLGMAAGLDQEEWTRFAAMVRSRLAIELGELAGEGGS